ncbi:MAG: gamma-glutamyltransferase [Rhodospirillaceae bacterium]|nr:gamma-glutamyltransferase [Rhodospirillaceae bacterium]
MMPATQTFTTRPEILGTFGVVTSTHWLATAVGMAILEKGGNAFDAGVATGFALQVVEPHLNGPGGDVPIIIHTAHDDKTHVICGQGVSAAGQTIEKMTAMGHKIMPGTGHLSAVVPGAFSAWTTLLRDFGTMRLREVLEPAIEFASGGYALVPNICNTIATIKPMFEDEWHTSRDIWLKNGEVPQAGTLFKNEIMADMYRRILKEAEAAGGGREAEINAAHDAWYKGFVAEAIDTFMKTPVMDTTGERHAGFLTGDDMAEWKATIEAPLTYDYMNYTVCKTGPWGQGPALLQQLALLKGFDLSSMPFTGPEFVHVVTECAKLAFADREKFYGDPDFIDIPMDVLLSDEYNNARRALIGDTASLELRPGDVPGFGADPIKRMPTPEEQAQPSALGIGEPTVARFDDMEVAENGAAPGDTCHFDIIDKHGNMISGTPSGGWLQSNPAVPGLGFCLTNRAQMYWLDETKQDCLRPKSRPRTTLSPGFALRDGKAWMPFGTPGGDQQDQWALGYFVRKVHYGLNLQEAIDAPAFHTKHFPSSFYPRHWVPGHLVIEGRFPDETQKDLIKRGHNLEVDDDWSIGRLTAACKEDGMLKAAANPRFMQGYAIGR